MQTKGDRNPLVFMHEVSPVAGSLLQQFADFSDNLFFALGLSDKQLLYLSPAYTHIWQSSAEDLATVDYKSIFRSIHADDKALVLQACNDISAAGGESVLEFRILSLAGEEKWLKVKYRVVQYEHVDVIIGIAEDITAEKEYQNTIYRYFDKKNTMLDVMAHDLTSPLHNIESAARVLLDQNHDNEDGITLELLEKITEISRTCVNKIYGLFNKELLDVSEAVMMKENIDIAEHIRSLVDEYRQANNLVSQHFHFKASAGQVFMTIDVVKIMQVVANLLSNALKFTRDNGNVWVTIEDKGEQILLSVRDDGIGIPVEMQPYLFNRYTKAKRPGLKGEPTVGLGLHIISNIIRQHNGTIRVESSEGNGTTFLITIPKFS